MKFRLLLVCLTLSVFAFGEGRKFSFGPSFGVLGGNFGFGADGVVLFQVAEQSPFYAGFMTGFNRWSAETISTTAFPLMGTAIYRLGSWGKQISPYVGAAAGIAFSSSTGSDSEVKFAGVLRPGIDCELDRQTAFFVEPKFGLIGGSFLFMPALGVSFSF